MGSGVTYSSNDPDVLTKPGREAGGCILLVGEVAETAMIQTLLKVLEVQGQLEDGLVSGGYDWWEALPLLEWMGQSQRSKAES